MPTSLATSSSETPRYPPPPRCVSATSMIRSRVSEPTGRLRPREAALLRPLSTTIHHITYLLVSQTPLCADFPLGSSGIVVVINGRLKSWRADERTRTAYPCSSYE